ncbi:MAG TPA: enoyl-CoA hydratase-related protein [Caulobacteraceae bacterium]|jgi:enoyl-CoA hydratase/carnithine racemase|nr:enoyl-CoA hydratase-related protein [Caulobacteraceae bacterium]
MDPATLPIVVRREPRDGGLVATVTFNEPARLNALSVARMTAFVEAMATISAEPALRAVVLRGAGKAFLGGADIEEMAKLADPLAARAFILRVHACCQAVRECPVPVIAAIHGHCLGAGLELAAACDLRLAADDARLGMPEVRLGLPSVVEAALLPQLVGWGQAKRLVYLGETLDAAEALRIGLVDRVVGSGELEGALGEWLGHLLAAGPDAIRAQKALIRRWEGPSVESAIAAGVDAFEAAFRGPEPARMLGDFQAARGARKGG